VRNAANSLQSLVALSEEDVKRIHTTFKFERREIVARNNAYNRFETFDSHRLFGTFYVNKNLTLVFGIGKL